MKQAALFAMPAEEKPEDKPQIRPHAARFCSEDVSRTALSLAADCSPSGEFWFSLLHVAERYNKSMKTNTERGPYTKVF